jgi:hypothetical protein
MKTFLAIYMGTEAAIERWRTMGEAERKQREAGAMEAWTGWGRKHAAAIVDQGTPLGRTKRVSANGVTDTKNAMTGYVLVRAESADAAAKMFEGHPHFSMFPGDSVEIMECLPMPPR